MGGWQKDVMSWLNYWGIKKKVTLENIDNIKNIRNYGVIGI